ncbi:MAG TPA: hypothetical protein O0X89_02580, partial [Methanocorpusculum sp.]|nr:hypothetical protein [Methanocorpusculum sp.]
MADINLSGIADSLFNSTGSPFSEIDDPGFLGTQPFLNFGIKMTYGDLIAVLLILIATFIIAKIVSGLVRRMFSGSIEKSNLSFMEKLTRWIIYFFG